MQKKETERERKRKALLGEKKEVCSKKSLTGPTLLEMSGNATNQELTTAFLYYAAEASRGGRSDTVEPSASWLMHRIEGNN
jgi:hypothetical protein